MESVVFNALVIQVAWRRFCHRLQEKPIRHVGIILARSANES